MRGNSNSTDNKNKYQLLFRIEICVILNMFVFATVDYDIIDTIMQTLYIVKFYLHAEADTYREEAGRVALIVPLMIKGRRYSRGNGMSRRDFAAVEEALPRKPSEPPALERIPRPRRTSPRLG